MQNYEDALINSMNEHHRREKFRETSKDLKFIKVRNTLENHT